MRNKLTRSRNAVKVGARQSKSAAASDGGGSDSQVITNTHPLQTHERNARTPGVFVRTAKHASAKTACKENNDEDQLNGLLPEPVSPPRDESFQSFQSVSPKRQRYEATGPCTAPVSASSQHNCLEEIKKSNRAFPARMVFSSLQKKYSANIGNLLLSPGTCRS